MQTFVEVGVSSKRIFGYIPSKLQAGSNLVCVDLPYDVAGWTKPGLAEHIPIYPGSEAALSMAAAGDENAQRQYARNLRYERICERAGVAVSMLTGDGRRLDESLPNGADEVLLQNVFSDPALDKEACHRILLGCLSALKSSGKLVCIETYTPMIAQRNLGRLGRFGRLGRQSRTHAFKVQEDLLKVDVLRNQTPRYAVPENGRGLGFASVRYFHNVPSDLTA